MVERAKSLRKDRGWMRETGSIREWDGMEERGTGKIREEVYRVRGG